MLRVDNAQYDAQMLNVIYA